MTKDLTTQTPVEIDTRMVELQFEWARLESEAERYGHAADNAITEARFNEFDRKSKAARAALPPVWAELSTIDAEFKRRGGWTRYHLVTNAGGHVHTSRDCGTCYRTTQFVLLPAHSGMTHEDLVALAGERACSVCFKGIEGLITAEPSRLSWDVEARAARDAEKDAKEAEKARKLAKAGGPLNEPVKLRYGTAKTVQQAKTAVVDGAVEFMFRFGKGNQCVTLEKLDDAKQCKAAIIATGADWDELVPELTKKAKTKYRARKREGEKMLERMPWLKEFQN